MTTTVIETCEVPRPAGVAAEVSVPLSFFDYTYIPFQPVTRLIFYDHPCSELEFLNTIVPKLKQSLSLSLKHYLPVAANLYYPLDTERNHPLIRYVSGDTVPLTIAVSSRDFTELTGKHPRESDQFYDFMPEMPPLRDEGEYKLVPLIALQLTLFPGRGVCIGLSNHHCLGDARSVVGFMWAWAEINKCGGDEEFLSRNGESLPFFDRSVFGEDSSRINTMFWNTMKKIPLKQSSFPLPTNRVRASFTLNQSDIKKLKNLVLSHNPALLHVSSFVVTAAYVWSCLVKSAGEEVGGDETENFVFPADGRGRPNALVDPPVPVNYFGNCLGIVAVSIEHWKVAANQGFLAAAEAIADEVNNQVYNKDNFLNGWENLLPEKMAEKFKMSSSGVTGSPKFDLLKADFGWGKGRRLEVLFIDIAKYLMSLCNSSDCDGGLVAGLSLPRERMEAFSTLFEDGLKS